MLAVEAFAARLFKANVTEHFNFVVRARRVPSGN
jgi:hypothetical protein